MPLRICFNCIIWLYLLLGLSPVALAQRADTSGWHGPSIGVTLSGGGAKGLAHIGILKAIDSAGLDVRYVTGTSMGGVIGALYAIGYSGHQIDSITRTGDWNLLLSNGIMLRALSMDAKDQYHYYLLSFPIIKGLPKMPEGLLESEELWLKLSEVYFPVYREHFFKHFYRSFQCVATDVTTQQAVALDTGSLVKAVRASMSIPSFFTPVSEGKHLYIDGGVVDNFPVSNAMAMGAGLVIGSSVVTPDSSEGNKYPTVINVLLHIALYRQWEDMKKQAALTSVFIDQKLDRYNMMSFNQASRIIEEGDRIGRLYYPKFKHIKDSISDLHPDYVPRPAQGVPNVSRVFITALKVQGINRTQEIFFKQALDFHVFRWYKASEISASIRKAFGTEYYQRITYELKPQGPDSALIVFSVQENPLNSLNLGIDYNKLAGLGLVVNLTFKNILNSYSRTELTTVISNNFRFSVEHVNHLLHPSYQYFSIGVSSEAMKLDVYSLHFVKMGQMRRWYSSVNAGYAFFYNRYLLLQSGFKVENLDYKPIVPYGVQVDGNQFNFLPYLLLHVNTLDDNVFPRSGVRLSLEGSWIFQQRPNFDIYSQQKSILNVDSLGLYLKNFGRLDLSLQQYIPFSSRLTGFYLLQTGIQFNRSKDLLNRYLVGGLNTVMHNQILFAGLNEGSLTSSSVASIQVGFRREFPGSFYLSLRGNLLYYNLLDASNHFRCPPFLSGYSLSLGHTLNFMPIELSTMYCDQLRRILYYLNIGFRF